MAQFVYDGHDIDEHNQQATAVPPHVKSTASSSPATRMETDDVADSSLIGNREKDKEKDKKEKEKEKDSSKDTVSIEVCRDVVEVIGAI